MSLKRAHGLKRPHGLERPQGRALGLVLMVAAFLLLAGLGQGHAAGAPVAITPTVGHDAAAGTLAISGDGRFAASAGSENGVKFWSLSNGRLIRTFIGHTRSVQALAFAPGGRYLASGGGDGSIRFWEIETGAEAARIDIPDDLVNALAFSADGRLLVAGTRDRLAVVWDVASGRRLAEVKGDGDQALAVAISGDGRSALSIGYGATLSIIDIRKGRVARTVKIAGNGAFSLAFSADGSRLAVAEPEGVTNIWDGTTGRRLVAFAEDAGVVSRIAISADGRTVVTTGTGGFRIWSADTGRPLASVAEAGRQFFAVALSADGKLVLTSDNLDPGDAPGSAWMASGRLALWNGDGGKPLRRLAGTSTSIYSLAVSPDGTRFATGHVAGDVQSWNLAAARLSAPVAASADIVHGLGFAADGMIVSVAGSAIGFFDPETGAELATLPLKGMVKLRGAAFSSDGTRAIVASEPVDEMEAGPEERERTVIVDLLKRKIVRDLGDAGMGVSALAFAPDAGIAVIASYGEIRLVDAARGRVARTLPLKDGVVDAIAISPDGRLLAVGSQTEAQLLDTRKGRVLRQFQGLGDVVERLVFSPDGTRLAAASYDGSALVWNVGTGELAARLEGHAAPVFDVAFTPDGRRLLTAGWDTMTRIWDIASGKTLASFIAFSEANWVSITPFGFFDASGHGAEMLNVVRGLDVLPIDRVFQALYRPDLVHEALAGDPAGRVRDAAAKLDLASALDSGPPPAVRFAGPANGASVPAGETLVAASITDQGGGIGRIEWRVNGVTLGVDERGLARIEMPAKASTVERRLILGPGDNVVELVAYNAGDLVASEPARLALTVAAPDDTAPPRLHVLAVGINDYWDSRLRLNFAVPDARSVAEALARAGAGLFASVDVETLFDADVTTAGLDRRFSEIAAKVAPQDVFVFFLAGHGKTVEGRYYFLPYDFRYEGEPSITAAGIGQDVWQQWFARIPAGRSVLLYDTCESGSLTGDGLGTRGLERVAAMERITRAMGRTVLSAATDDQPALEGYRGHGVFTWTLLDALANADTDADNEIAVTELAGYVDRKVPEISEAAFGLRQIPQMRIVGSNFPLGARVAVLGDAPAATLPVEPTHVLIRAAVVRAGADADAPELIELSPGTQVRLIETSGAVGQIARDGRPLGFVPIDALVRLQ